MAETPRQMAFALPASTALGRADFLVSPANARVVQALDTDWPTGKLILIGPRGAGKTHLARIWAGEQGAVWLSGHQPFDPSVVAPRAVVLDDADAVAGTPSETALFHLHNMIEAAGGRLLLTASSPPSRWPLRLPDLASRLAATSTTQLEPPDDALLAAVLVKLFADRQLTVSPGLLGYITTRMERSLATAQALVAALDARALAEGRAITRAMAAEWLDNSAAEAP